MPKYLCLQRSLTSSDDATKRSPAEMKEMYGQFGAWSAKFKENLVDMGGKLGAGRLVTAKAQTGEPVVEVSQLAGGYMLVSAASLEEAIEIASACPGLVRPGSGVEVIEVHSPS